MCRFKGSFEIGFGCCNRGRIVDIDGCDGSCRFGQRSGGLGTHRDIGYVIGDLLGYFVVDILKITFQSLHVERTVNVGVVFGDIRRQVLNNVSFDHLSDLILGLALELVDRHEHDSVLNHDVKVASLDPGVLLFPEPAILFGLLDQGGLLFRRRAVMDLTIRAKNLTFLECQGVGWRRSHR